MRRSIRRKKSRSHHTRRSPSAAALLCAQHQEDLRIARDIQRALVPRSLPAAEGLDIASLYLPGELVGGDLYDVIPISEDLLAFIVFDVSGHGVSSALIASMAKASFLNHIRMVASPRSVLERVNEEMVREIRSEHFISAFVAYFDLHNNKLIFSNAGHTPPLLYRHESKETTPLEAHGLFVGIIEGAYYEEKILYLSPGDWLLMFSNGLHELFDSKNELRGKEKLAAWLCEAIRDCSPATLLGSFKDRHRALISAGRKCDDIGVVAVEILTQSRKDQIKTQLGFDVTAPVYLQFISYFEDMDRAAAVILREMDEYGYPDDSIRKMKISLTELLANAIYHGNRKDHAKKVTIGHTIDTQCVKVSVMDEGEGFDIHNIPDPTLPENLEKDRGRGLFIVRNYVDRLEFNERGNRVTITKHNTPGP